MSSLVSPPQARHIIKLTFTPFRFSTLQSRIVLLEEERLQSTSELATKREELASGTREIAHLRDTILALETKLSSHDADILSAKEVTVQLDVERELRSRCEVREETERRERIAACAQLLATQTESNVRMQQLEEKATATVESLRAELVDTCVRRDAAIESARIHQEQAIQRLARDVVLEVGIIAADQPQRHARHGQQRQHATLQPEHHRRMGLDHGAQDGTDREVDQLRGGALNGRDLVAHQRGEVLGDDGHGGLAVDVEAEGLRRLADRVRVPDVDRDAGLDRRDAHRRRWVLRDDALESDLRANQRSDRRNVGVVADLGAQARAVGRMPDVVARVGQQPAQDALLALDRAVHRQQVAGDRRGHVAADVVEDIEHLRSPCRCCRCRRGCRRCSPRHWRGSRR